MARTRILIVDDEVGMLEVCGDTLQRLPDTEIVLEQRSAQAAERLRNENFDLLIADICMPDLDGVELLRIARQQDPEVAALMLTAFPTVETAVESMKLGASDYLTKPFLPDDLLANVRSLLENRQLREENRLLRRQVERSYASGKILGENPLMVRAIEDLNRIADTDFDVLIIGETGTGKELIARAIHHQSRRRDGPFVPVDCGAIPDTLMESEFFGHERGAFTGAATRSLGLLEFASHGTFFLDELSQLPLTLQAKLLRVLQERKVRRVGGTKEIDLDVRIIAASSMNVEDEVAKGRFRQDLYHRINVTQIHLPPLRDRVSDIPLLANHFLDNYARELERDQMKFSPEALEIIAGYPWPGNVRELQNTVKRVLALTSNNVIVPDDLPDEIVARAGDTEHDDGFFEQRQRRMAAFEEDYLRQVLSANHGDVSAAAAEAQLPRGTFYRLLKKYDLSPADFRGDEE